MKRKLFVNLPVKNIDASVEFFKKIGFEFNPNLTNKTAACLVTGDDSSVMLVTHSRFKDFTHYDVGDSTRNHEALICLTMSSRQEVDELTKKAIAAGGKSFRDPMDYEVMYGQSFMDLDGHVWELIWIDESSMAKACAKIDQIQAQVK